MKIAGLLLALFFYLCGQASAQEPIRYLAFQIFTGPHNSPSLQQSFPPPPDNLRAAVVDLRDSIGQAPNAGRQLTFIVGPLSFDDTDDQVQAMIASGFDIALETGVAVGFHIDDSMFWGRLAELNTNSNIEWLDWHGTPNTGRRLDWSETPTKIMPQLCLNSPAVKKAVADRAHVIGDAIAKGMQTLHTAHKDDLFAGVIAGWEAQMGRDFDSGKYLGYCALTNAGYSADHPPADVDVARATIVSGFIDYWAQSLQQSSVPKGKLFSHIAFMSLTLYGIAKTANQAAASGPYLQSVNFTPPSAAFCKECIPGFSTYPQPGLMEQWLEERAKHGDPAWASSEGSPLDPGQAEHSGAPMDMEGYLGDMFNHGAILVNLFGWRVTDAPNPFRKAVESDEAIAAYRKFLAGKPLKVIRIPNPEIPPEGLADRIHHLQALLPRWVEKNGPAKVQQDITRLDQAMKEQRYRDADNAVEALRKIIGE